MDATLRSSPLLVPEAHVQVERYLAAHLPETATVYWLAERDGRPARMLSSSPGGAAGSLVAPPEYVYLAKTYTLPKVRGQGVTTALLRHALWWAHDMGFRWCAANWDCADLKGSRFWRGHRFRPIAARAYRLRDERILWALAQSQ